VIVDPKVDVAPVPPEDWPNAEGCAPAKDPNPPPVPNVPVPLFSAGALDAAAAPNAVGPELAKAENAPPVAGLTREDWGCEVCPKADVGCVV